MKTGFHGTFVIAWSQTETDGVAGGSLDLLSVGGTWRWSGQAVRIDGPQDVLVLTGAEGMADLHRRAARMARRLIGDMRGPDRPPPQDAAPPDHSFVVTDGRVTYEITVLTPPDAGPPLLGLMGPLPPPDCDLWVVHAAIDRRQIDPDRQGGGVICFTPGTLLTTPNGQRLIGDLQPGDLVVTRDNGPQPVLWRGQRRISGARLHAMPHLRPIRFRRGALGADQPAPDLSVSPQHRMLITGPAALALYNTPEVLVAAADLINDQSVTVDYAVREVTYIHILLAQHNLIWANGLATESFHPANAAPGSLDADQHAAMLVAMPDLAAGPQAYGPYARRNLSCCETAILRHDMRA